MKSVTSRQPLLFEQYQQLASIPWVPLADLPTPVQRIELHPGVETWIKRDDLTSRDYGGNKVPQEWSSCWLTPQRAEPLA